MLKSFGRHFQLIALVIVMTVSLQLVFRYIMPMPNIHFTTEKTNELLQLPINQETNRTQIILNKFDLRRKHIENTCKIFSNQVSKQKNLPKEKPDGLSVSRYVANDTRLSQKVSLNSHLIDKKRKVTYCWLHKVASSFWMWIFLWIKEGKQPDPKAKPYTTQYSMTPKTTKVYQNTVANYENIILVRHPIERLVSAYRDKIAGLKASYKQYTNIARALHLRRNDAVIDVKLKTKTRKEGKINSKETIEKKSISVPSWPEFVEYLLRTSTEKDDPHWCLYTKHCSPCLSNFTYIVYLENKEEEDLVLRMTGLGNITGGVKTMNPTSGGKTTSVLQEYVSQLKCRHITGLKRRYWADLLLFQYDMDSMLKWGNGGKGCQKLKL